MVKRIITIVLVVAVLGVVISDAYAYSMAQRSLRAATYDLAMWAAKSAPDMTRDQAAAELAVMGPERGVVVYQYGQDNDGIQIWTQSTVGKTFVAGTLMNLMDGKSFSEAREAPFVIRDYREAGVQ